MVGEKKISAAVIRRLPRYYRYLGELIESGVQRISSKELSAKMKVTASQIRQDLNNFGGFGAVSAFPIAAPAMVPTIFPMAEPRYPPLQPRLLSPISPPIELPRLPPIA